MSLDGLRDAYSREKKNEIANCELSRKRKLRELYNYTALLNAGHAPQLQDWSWATSDDISSEDERRFLDQNDITKRRRFNDATLEYPNQHASLPPTLPFQVPAKPAFSKPSPAPFVAPPSLEDQLRAASASPSVATQTIPSIEAPSQPVQTVQKSTAPPKLSSPQPLPAESAPEIQPEVQTPVVEEEVKDELPAEPQQPVDAPSAETLEAQEEVLERAVSPDEPSVDPSKAIPPTADDVEAPNDLPTPATNGTEEHKAPQVVHLPPREVQEARLEETEHKLEKAREKEKKEEERLALPISASAPDAASSPSSTVGPYSQATPRAPNHSPVTSPDTETFQDNVPPSAQEDLEGDLAAQQAKEEHERALQRQMQEARERTRAESSDTPEVERQLEDEQAIRLARDGKSHLYESQPRSESQGLTEQAEEVAQAVVPQAAPVIEEKPMTEPAADSLPTPTTTTAPEPAPTDPEVTDDVPDEAQVTAPAVVEQPTPPEDVDVEMDDSPLPAEAQEKAATQTEPTQPDPVISHTSPERTQQKNVPELIEEKAATEAVLGPRSSNPSGTLSSPARPRATDHTAKPLTTVIFAKQDANRSAKALHIYNEEYAGLQGASQDSGRDYLEGLFQYQAHHPPRSAPLADLVAQARKTVSTAGTLAMIREAQDYKILKRVYQLQNANRWSLRQLQKSAEPPRPVCHQDHLLKEMKWMSTDFREERKWKKALATSFAEWCAEYVNGSPDLQASLRVRSYIPKHARQLSGADEDMNDAPTPELIPSGLNEIESESVDDDDLLSSFGANPPAGLFSLGFNDVVMKLDWTPASEAMLQELPSYEPLLEGAPDVTPVSFCDPPILPVSKFITGKLVSKVRGPPRKRSRYEYDSEDEPSSPPSRSGTSAEHSMPSTPGRRLYHRNDLPAEMTDVALFNPENKHVRDRLQAAHQFRPPTEFPMPSVSFFENRQSSQWLWEEDQKLRGLVKEYTFNWSLVAQQLALPSMYVSGSGRRTPWECFERWVQLEGLPAEMSKTQYFRTYQTRLEQAQRTVTAQHQAQQQLLQQQAQQGQAISGQARRRTTQPIRVERRRENRHLAIIDGMRKLARKRESIAHKQAESQKAAQLRKAHEPAPPKSNVHTPQEFSRLKWEREEKMKQKMQMQQELNMRAMAAAAQRQAGMQGQPGMANGVNPQQRTGTPSNNGNVAPAMANSSSQPGHPPPNPNLAARQHPGQQQQQQAVQTNYPNGNMSGMPLNNTGVPQAQIQATMQNTQRMGPPMAMQRSQFPNTQQHQFQLQQQQINMASNLTANMGMTNGMPNANMMGSMAGQNTNGNMNATMNGSMNGSLNGSMNGMSNNAGSPRLNQVNPQMHNQQSRPLSSGHMPQLLQIQNSLKTSHPEWTSEQVQKMASDQLQRYMAKQRQQAMSAASGSSTGMNSSPQVGNNHYISNGQMQNSPSPNAVQNYQNQLLAQQRMIMQQQRQNAGSPGMNGARPVSRSATPQNPQQLGLQSPSSQQPRTQ